MRIEFRSSGGPTCEECGSYELLRVTASNRALESELGEITERAFDQMERALLELWEEEKVGLTEVLQAETKATADEINKAHAAFEERVAVLLGERAPKWRVIRRRQQDSLERRFNEMCAELRSQTRRV